jgi:hypothetical protein
VVTSVVEFGNYKDAKNTTVNCANLSLRPMMIYSK